jgi:outer membrane protein TolC
MSPLKSLPLLLASAMAVSAHAEPMTLGQALDRADASAPSLEAQTLRIDAARAEARAAGALPDARLTLGIDNLPVTGPFAGQFGDDEMTMASVGLMQEVPSGAKREARAARAAADIGVAQAQAMVEARELRLATALAWLDLYYAKRRLAALDGLAQTLAPVIGTAPSGVASGMVRPAETVGPEQWKAMLADRRSGLLAQIGRSRADLARWTGDPNADVDGAPPDIAVDATGFRAALDRHPVLLAFDAAARQADAAVRLAKADKRPDWSWEVSYGRRDPAFGDMVSAEVTISLPLFPERRQDPVIEARSRDATRVRVEREVARRKLLAELEAGLADHVLHHDRRRRALEVLVPLAQRRADLETASYGGGRVSLVVVLDSFTALADAKLDALDREAETARDAFRLNIIYGSEGQ